MTQDFEALGRYIDAQERMEKAVEKRKNLAIKIHSLSYWVIDEPVLGHVNLFDVTKAEEIVSKISKLDEEIKIAVAEMNSNAKKCGKPIIKLDTSA